jgi:hypothetical protein
MKKQQRRVHFNELRKGRDMAYFLRRALKFGEFAEEKVHSLKHMRQTSTFT